MRFIGITGGAGAGKSEILSYLAKKPGVKVMLADEIAHEQMEPGTDCYRQICEVFAGEDLFLPGGGFDRKKMASVIFSDERRRERVNAIVHPAVRKSVLAALERERAGGRTRLLVLEAALLIEERYDEVCDELWYIYATEEVRTERLLNSRGYSREKVRRIFESQLAEEEYRRKCRVVIDNNGTVEEALRQLDEVLENMNFE